MKRFVLGLLAGVLLIMTGCVWYAGYGYDDPPHGHGDSYTRQDYYHRHHHGNDYYRGRW